MKKEIEICESCGNYGEIGYVIQDGDEVSTLHITSNSYTESKEILNDYLKIAKNINEKVSYTETFDMVDKTLTVQLYFSVSAEKIIFELKTRHLNR